MKLQVCNNWQTLLTLSSVTSLWMLLLQCLASPACVFITSLFALNKLRDCTDVSTHAHTHTERCKCAYVKHRTLSSMTLTEDRWAKARMFASISVCWTNHFLFFKNRRQICLSLNEINRVLPLPAAIKTLCLLFLFFLSFWHSWLCLCQFSKHNKILLLLKFKGNEPLNWVLSFVKLFFSHRSIGAGCCFCFCTHVFA